MPEPKESLRARFFGAAAFAERYLLSAMYLWLAWRGLQPILHWAMVPHGSGMLTVPFAAVIREANLTMTQLFIGLLLLICEKPVQAPKTLREIFIPLAMSLYYLLYSLAPRLPEALRASLCPAPWRLPLGLTGLAFGVLGSIMAIWGVMYLGRSFGIFVSVRTVVLRGPYRFVRHPIYFGYLLLWVGLVLANQSIATLALVAGQTALLIHRARLEERRLAEASPEYRLYREQVGFLFPRHLWKGPSPAATAPTAP